MTRPINRRYVPQHLGRCGCRHGARRRALRGGTPDAEARADGHPPLARLQPVELLPGPQPRRRERPHHPGGRLQVDPRLGLRFRASAYGLLVVDRFRLPPDQEASARRHAEDQRGHAGEDQPRRRPRAEILDHVASTSTVPRAIASTTPNASRWSCGETSRPKTPSSTTGTCSRSATRACPPKT